MKKIALSKLEFESLRLARHSNQIIVTEITSQILAQKLRSKGFDLNQLIIIDISEQDPTLLQSLSPAQEFIRIEAAAIVAEQEAAKLLKHLKHHQANSSKSLTKRMLSELSINQSQPIETIVSNHSTPDASITLKIPHEIWNLVATQKANTAYQHLIASKLLRASVSGSASLITFTEPASAVALNASSLDAQKLAFFLEKTTIIKKDSHLSCSIIHQTFIEKPQPITLCVQPTRLIQSLLNQTSHELLKSAAGAVRLVG